MNTQMQKLSSGLLVFLMTALGGMSAQADDTEIFFGGQADSTIQPNVLFILDNSGSMDDRDCPSTGGGGWGWGGWGGGGGDSCDDPMRIDRMKTAMTQLLTGLNNVNVGIMQFSQHGAALMYPIKDIDASLTSPEPIYLSISSSDDDAEQNTAASTVTTDNPRLAMTTRSSSGNNSVSTSVTASNDDAEELVSSSSINFIGSASLELPFDNLGNSSSLEHAVGLIFRDQSIPAGATIISANIRFVIEQASDGSTAQNTLFSQPISLTIAGELAGDSTNINDFSTQNISSRTTTAASADWNIVDASPSVGETEFSANIGPVIQELVDQGDWTSGSSDIALIVRVGGTDDGARVFSSFDDSPDNSPTLFITYEDPASSTPQVVGLRYTSVGVPQGATITGANLRFISAADQDSSVTYNIYGDAASDAVAFSDTDNLTSRSSTANTISWTPGEWDIDQTYSSPDLSDIIQDIVDNEDWCGGNSLALLLANGSDTRFSYSYDNSPSTAPSLSITYDADSIPADGGCISSSVSYAVSSSNDDGYGKTTGGGGGWGWGGWGGSNNGNKLSENTVYLGYGSSSDRIAGFRFSNLQIPADAVIQNAYLEFTAKTTNSSTANFTIKVEDTDNADVLCSNDSSSCRLKDKTYNGTTLSWNSVPAWTQDFTYQSPDVSSLVQLIVNKNDWSEGNAILFAITGTSGSGLREAVAYDDSALKAARLVVSYRGNVTSSSGTVRESLKNIVEQMEPRTYTPIANALYEASRYFRGEALRWGDKRTHLTNNDGSAKTDSNTKYMRVSHEDSYTGGTVYWPSGCSESDLDSSNCALQIVQDSPVYESPITSQCQTNHIVLLTDGEPNQNESQSIIKSLINSTTCTGTNTDGSTLTSGGTCTPELLNFLNTDDQSDLTGTQTVQTHTIAFNSSDASAYLDTLASNGGTVASQSASTADDLLTAFENIVGGFLDTDTTFVSPGVTVNTFNRLTHRNEIYFALFSPKSTPSWPGNLKRYSITSSGVVTDANGDSAIDDTTGFFKDTANSYWSGSIEDGANSAIGGAAYNLPASTSRNIFTYYSGSTSDVLSSPVNELSIDNAAITKAMLGISAETDSYRDNLINWARGLDPDTGLERNRLSDPLHSVPHLVTYGGTDDAPDITIFYGDNEGFLHAIDATHNTSTNLGGEEHFAFIPEVLLPNLNALKVNSSDISHPYGIDGFVNSWVIDVDGDLQVEEADGDKVYVYFGMRRGGRNYYALDVTDRSSPEVLWTITGGSGDYTELGQSWSKPVKTKVNVDGTVTDVLIMAGGYDEDQDDVTLITADDVGRAIYFVNALTGDKVWSVGPTGGHDLQKTDMIYSIPSTVRVLDTNSDGLADQMYVGDVGGQLWRFDINNGSATSSLVTGAVIADVSGSTADSARRFYHEPDVSLIIENNQRKLAVAIGSGFQAHPLSEATTNRLYVIKLSDVTSAPADGADGDTDPDYTKLLESNLYDATENLIGEGTAAQQATALADLASASGWYITLEDDGEKVLSTPLAVSGELFFTTYSPTVNTIGCEATNGTSRLYRTSVLDATPTNTGEDGDTSLDDLTKDDRAETLKTVGLPSDPVRLRIEDANGTKDVLCVGTECQVITSEHTFIKTYWYAQ